MADVLVTITVPLPVIVPAGLPELITTLAPGVKTAPEFTVNVPETPKLLFAVTAALEARASPEKVRVAELDIELPFAKVIVPPEGAKLPLAPTVIAASILKDALVDTVADAAMARVLNTRVFEFAIELLLFIVTVPPLGEKLPDTPTAKAPPTAKETLEVFVPLKVTPLKVIVPELLIEVVPVSKTIVPPVGARVLPVVIASELLMV